MAEHQGLPTRKNTNSLSQWSQTNGLWPESSWWPVFVHLRLRHGFDIFKGLLKTKAKLNKEYAT